MRWMLASLWVASVCLAGEPEGGDCAPLGHPPGFTGQVLRSAHDAYAFPGAGDAPPTQVVGRWCHGTYELQPHTPEPAPRANVAFYLKQLSALGAQVVLSDDWRVVARLEKAGHETWFHMGADGGWGSRFLVWVVEQTPFVPTLRPPSGRDYRLLGHLPGYELGEVTTTPNDDVGLDLVAGAEPVHVQGLGRSFIYRPTGAHLSDWDVLENYQQALVAKQARVLSRVDHGLTVLLEDGGQQIFIALFVFGEELSVRVIEEQPLDPKVEDLGATFEKTGRLVLYVKFDFNQATLRPEAAPVIAQVVALLKAKPSVRLSVDGYTDTVGGDEANQRLSEARAAAVAAALIKGGEAKARLTAAGHGPRDPLASNETSAGRAKNRRVELVRVER
jgi:outer membrane protein OmpA-like peptidoglycan-associated protein